MFAMSKLVSRSARSFLKVRPQPVRHMGGSHHDHSHGHEEQAYFLGIKPDTPSEGFEIIYAVTMIGCTVVVVGGSMMKTDDDFHTWARREAIARERVVEAGGEIEFAKYYQTTQYAEDTLGLPPVLNEE